MQRRRLSTKRSPQQELVFSRRGGARPGSGRKPKGARAGVSHLRRPRLASRFPVLISLRVTDEVWNLRSKRCFRRIRDAFGKGCDRGSFRLTHYSVQGNHMHLVAEAASTQALARGMQGLAIRIARSLNRLMGRTGRVFSDRYHARILKSPREVRHALSYVLCNARRHRLVSRDVRRDWVDPFSSASWFDGWKCGVWFDPSIAETSATARAPAEASTRPPVAPPRTWLLRTGWRRLGLLDPARVPTEMAAGG